MGKKRKEKKKKNLTKIVSLNKREICFIELDPYVIYCNYCGEKNERKQKCVECKRSIVYDRVQKGTRPVVVVHVPDMSSVDHDQALVLAIPLTTTEMTGAPGTVVIPADENTKIDKPGRALVFNLTSYDKKKFFEENRKGKVGDEEWEQIIDKLKTLLSINDKVISIDDEEYHANEIKQILAENEATKRKIVDLEETESKYKTLKHKSDQQKNTYERNIKREKKQYKESKKMMGKLEKEVDRLKQKVTDLEKRDRDE